MDRRAGHRIPLHPPKTSSSVPHDDWYPPPGASADRTLLHGGSQVGGWTAKQIHHAVFTTFHLSDSTYGLNQLRYDLRKLKAHRLLQRDGSCYAYRLTPKPAKPEPNRLK